MRLPAGTRDWLPAELHRKRAVESVLRSVFERWAYAEVQTPSFERVDALEIGIGERAAEQAFRFADRSGTTLALRPEMTTPVARLVATRMRAAPLPLRLSYVASAYRHEDVQEGRMRETTEAGLELVGPESLDADAESLFTALEALDALGFTDARVDVNHVAIVAGALAGLDLDAEQTQRAKTLIAGRNLVALRAMLADRGDAGIARLRAILERADELGYGDRIAVDCALLRDFTYYTGFIFEAFATEVGFELAGGGRYDALLPRFGFDVGAVGWSLAVERILIALERRQSAHFGAAPAVDVLVSGSDVVAARERAAGRVVRIDFDRLDEAALLAEARAKRIPRVVVATEGAIVEHAVTW